MNEARNPLKLLACITELDVGGAEKAFVRILIGLKAVGWDITVVSVRDCGLMADELIRNNIPVLALGCGGFADVRTFFRMKKIVRRCHPDVILTFLHQANFYARLAAKTANAKVVCGVRVADGRPIVTWTDRLTSGLVDEYVGVSQQVMRRHQDWCALPGEKCQFIPNGVDCATEFDESLRATNRILFVGRLTEQKSPQTLILAISLLHRQGISVTAQFVGDGPLHKKLVRQVADLGIQQQVEFCGHRSDVAELMQQATLLALPSKWEGMPNVVLEAMANRLPVVASEVDGVHDLIQDGQTGILVSPGNPEELAAAVAQLFTDPKARSNIAKAAQNEAAEHFRWDSVIKQYDDLLKKLAAG